MSGIVSGLKRGREETHLEEEQGSEWEWVRMKGQTRESHSNKRAGPRDCVGVFGFAYREIELARGRRSRHSIVN